MTFQHTAEGNGAGFAEVQRANFPDATIIHYNGTKWRQMLKDTPYLHAVWGSSRDDVFAVGDQGTILHYNGQSWGKMDSGTSTALRGVWGTSCLNVFAVGDQGTILHYGGQWHQMDSGTSADLFCLWGSPVQNMFVVVGAGTILHHDGYRWTPMECEVLPPRSKNTFAAIWGSSARDVFVVMGPTRLLHYDGQRWTSVEDVAGDRDFTDVWGTSSSDVYVSDVKQKVLLHYDGCQWTDTQKSMEARRIWGSTPRAIFLLVKHYEWECPQAVWNAPEYDIFSGEIYVYDGDQCRRILYGEVGILHALWGTSARDIFAVGRPVVRNYIGYQ